MEQNKPLQAKIVFYFWLSIFGICGIIAWFFPSNGIAIFAEYKLKFANRSIFSPDLNSGNSDNVKDLLASYEIIADTTGTGDSLAKLESLKRKEQIRILVPAGQSHPLEKFFKALNELKSGKRSQLRIMHYGDSQIEGDRITGYIREQWQKKYGGNGPGLLPTFEAVPSSGIDQENDGNWKRYALFGARDTSVKHKRYGMLANFGRYMDVLPDSLRRDTKKVGITLRPNKIGYSKARSYSTLRMWLGDNKDSVKVNIFNSGLLVGSEIISPGNATEKRWSLGTTPAELRIEFEGKDSPNIWALSLEGSGGIMVDNIGLRGSSGTIFKNIDRSLLTAQLKSVNPGFFILQFGGNTIPYIKSKEEADQYGSWFAGQIKLLKQICPEASFLVVGPSDMAYKDGQKFVSYPYIEQVRDGIKSAAFAEGAAYWDLYEVMGGQNSMSTWVGADPPLAAPDYVHFSPKGTRTVSELLFQSIEEEYLKWKVK